MRDRAALAKLFQSDGFRAVVDQANTPDEKLGDAFTEDGVSRRVERATARHMVALHQEQIAQAEQDQQRAAFDEIRDRHPELKAEPFRAQVKALLTARSELAQKVARAQNPEITEEALRQTGRQAIAGRLEDAVLRVKYDQMLASQASRQAAEREARSRSAAQVRPVTRDASPLQQATDQLQRVMKEGYKGERGAPAAYLYLRDHPQVQGQIRESI